MKIDFNTRYTETGFNGLCEKAISLGLDGLVMTGLPADVPRNYRGLRLFPAQEADWSAAIEIPSYRTYQDSRDSKKEKDSVHVFKGKALVLMPQGKPLQIRESRLYQLLEQIKANGGASIALQDNKNWPITLAYDGLNKLYAFDAIRIRPYNIHDINSELLTAPVAVAGSDAGSASDLSPGKGFTVYENPISTQEELIQAIKHRDKTQLYVHNSHGPKRIEDTVKPLRAVIDPKIIEKLRKSI